MKIDYLTTELTTLDLIGYGETYNYKANNKFIKHDPNDKGVSINIFSSVYDKVSREFSVDMAVELSSKYEGSKIKYVSKSDIEINNDSIEYIKSDKESVFEDLKSLIDINKDNKNLDIILLDITNVEYDNIIKINERATNIFKYICDNNKDLNVAIIIITKSDIHASDINKPLLSPLIICPYMSALWYSNTILLIDKVDIDTQVKVIKTIHFDSMSRFIINENRTISKIITLD